MSNLLANWWRSRQFSAALKKGNAHLAQELLEENQRAGARLTLLEKVFRDKLQSDQSSAQYEREVVVLREQISQAAQTIQELSRNKQQDEQSLANVCIQLRHKEQEFVSIQQQLEAFEQENQGLRDQLKQKEQEFVSIQQQIVAHEQHIEDLRKQRNEMLAQKQTIEQLFEQKQQEVESLSKNKLQTANSVATLQEQLRQNQQEVALAQQKIETGKQVLTELHSQIKNDYFLLQPNLKFIEFISNVFKVVEHDKNKIQCTGIDGPIFYEFEATLAKYLEEEFAKIPQKRLSLGIKNAFEDINCLKNRQDPQYNFDLTPHVYFLHYFLDNVYCAYLAWFLIYKSGLLPNKLNILDIAAGPGTVAYGIALLLRSSSGIFQMPQLQISYCSLEKQSSFQYRGLQFWRRYIEPQQTATNAYFRFDTTDIFADDTKLKKLPTAFFNFIVVSHCFFAEQEQRNKSYEVYKKIFTENLTFEGYVLIIVQGTKLFRAYNVRQSEVLSQEQSVIRKLVEELSLTLEWYKYITSTGKREFIEDFSRFVRRNLPLQKFMSPLKRQHLGVNFDSHYTIDDYVILARR